MIAVDAQMRMRYLLIVSTLLLPVSCSGAVLRGSGGAKVQLAEEPILALEDSATTGRRLIGAGDGFFAPLACNSDVDNASCQPFSTLTIDPIAPLVIPCGSCYEVNEQDTTIEIPGGLHVDGKLTFADSTRGVTLKTPHVFVQGVLEMTDTSTVQPENKAVTIVLTSSDSDAVLTTHADQTGTSACASGCSYGQKAVVVAGGQTKIDAYPASCPTWTTIQATTDSSSPVVPPEEYEVPKSPPAGCTHELFRHQFSSASGALDWTGYLGAHVDLDDAKESLVISGRKRVWQGALYDLVDVRDCIVPEADYLLQAQMMLSHEDGQTGPTACKSGETSCLNMNVRTRYDDETDRWQTPFRQFDWAGSDYDEWFTVGGVIRFTEQEANETAVLYTYIDIDNFDLKEILHIKDFSLTLATSDRYLDSSGGDVCASLAPNGDAEAHGFNTFPYFIDHHRAELIVKEETLQDGSKNRYFHAYGRRHEHNSLRFTVPPSCMTAQSVYHFSTKLRLHSSTPQTPKVHYICKLPDGNYYYPHVTTCPTMSADDGWTTCSGTFTVETNHAECEFYQFYYWMSDATSDMDFDDVSLTRAQGGIESVVVADEVASCWGAGAEVLITSHTVHYDGEQVRKVVNATDNGDGTTLLKLNDTIKEPTTSANYATEIALLDRNVEIVGDDSNDDGVGGHFVIVNTPGVAQQVEGVALRNMGQQGINHRFPLHVQHCHNVEGTSLSRNSILGSQQRCINILGSHNVTVEKNIAYDTKGHCFALQDGVERENSFLRNLGARTLPVATRFSPIESDHSAATFWFTHPQNIIKGNVAAGSRWYGFRYGLSASTRTAESAAVFGDVDAITADLGEFHKNVAHSNEFQGLLMQYRPANTRAVFDKFHSYKNVRSGLKVDLSVNLAVTHGVFADNRNGVEVRRSDDVWLQHLTVEGQTPDYDIVKSQGDAWHDHCASTTSPVVGVLLHTYQYSSANPGVAVEDSTFTHFDNAEGCPNSAAFSFETQDNNNLHWANDPTTLKNVQVVDSRESTAFIDMCGPQGVGVQDVFLTDLDSSLNPDTDSSFSGVSAIVSDETHLTTFGASGCTNYTDACFSYCEGMCLRMVEIFTEPSVTASYSLKVRDDNSGDEIVIAGNQYAPSDFESTRFSNYRVFGLPLPAGAYTAEFVDQDGNGVWPPFVREIWNQKNPGCNDGSGLQVGDVSLVRPAVTKESPVCMNLLHNGDLEDGSLLSWRHNNGGIGYFADAGVGGSGAVGTQNRNSAYHGVGQYLDPRCVALQKHKYYLVQASFKLTDGVGGAEVTCDPNTNNLETDCPDGLLEYHSYDNSTVKSNNFVRGGIHPVAETVVPFKPNEWNLMFGMMFVTEEVTTANDLFFYMAKFNKNYEFIVDNASISPLEESCDQMIINGDFGTGDNRYWTSVAYRQPSLSMVPGTGGGNDVAIKSTGRTRNFHSPATRFSGGCLVEGNRYVLTAKYKIEDDDGNVVTCDPSYSADDGVLRCPEVLLKTYAPPDCTGDGCTSEYRTIGYAASPASSTGFSDLAWTFTATAKMGVAIRHHLYFNALNIAHNLVVDDVSLVPYKGTGQDCSDLIYNPDMEGGTGTMWINERQSKSKVTVYSPGADGSQYALRNTARSDNSNGFETGVDERCLVTNEVWDVTAQFRLLDATDNDAGVSCDTTLIHNPNGCPHIRLWADNCSDPAYAGGAGVWVYNQNGAAWNPDGWNAFAATFTVPESFSSCGRIRVLVRDVDADKDIVMDNIHITKQSP